MSDKEITMRGIDLERGGSVYVGKFGSEGYALQLTNPEGVLTNLLISDEAFECLQLIFNTINPSGIMQSTLTWIASSCDDKRTQTHLPSA